MLLMLLHMLQDIRQLAEQEGQEIEEADFMLNCASVQVSATLRNPDEWEVTPMDRGLVWHRLI